MPWKGKCTESLFSQSSNASRNDNHVVKQKHWLNYSLSSIELMCRLLIDCRTSYDKLPCYLFDSTESDREWIYRDTDRSGEHSLRELFQLIFFFLLRSFTDLETKFFFLFNLKEKTQRRGKRTFIFIHNAFKHIFRDSTLMSFIWKFVMGLPDGS